MYNVLFHSQAGDWNESIRLLIKFLEKSNHKSYEIPPFYIEEKDNYRIFFNISRQIVAKSMIKRFFSNAVLHKVSNSGLLAGNTIIAQQKSMKFNLFRAIQFGTLLLVVFQTPVAYSAPVQRDEIKTGNGIPFSEWVRNLSGNELNFNDILQRSLESDGPLKNVKSFIESGEAGRVR